MTIGKNKKLGKKRKAGSRKREDPFKDKEWYTIRAPAVFSKRDAGWTIATKTKGNKLSRDALMGRIFEVSLGDLKEDSEVDAFRKFKLRCEQVEGDNVLTTFYGLDFSTDKLRSLVKKWHSLIEANCEVVSTDGYKLRLFCIGFTRRRQNQNRKTSYAQASQVRVIRKFMVDIMKREASACSITELVNKLVSESIEKDIKKATNGVYPLTNVYVRKVKMLNAPKTSLATVNVMHTATAARAEAGTPMEDN